MTRQIDTRAIGAFAKTTDTNVPSSTAAKTANAAPDAGA
jgi:hypothetical protein